MTAECVIKLRALAAFILELARCQKLTSAQSYVGIEEMTVGVAISPPWQPSAEVDGGSGFTAYQLWKKI